MKGLHSHRIKTNPEEGRFARRWAEFAETNLGWLLNTGEQSGRCPPVSDRDEQVAATIIQWLGSPVGQSFLEEMGYHHK